MRSACCCNTLSRRLSMEGQLLPASRHAAAWLALGLGLGLGLGLRGRATGLATPRLTARRRLRRCALDQGVQLLVEARLVSVRAKVVEARLELPYISPVSPLYLAPRAPRPLGLGSPSPRCAAPAREGAGAPTSPPRPPLDSPPLPPRPGCDHRLCHGWPARPYLVGVRVRVRVRVRIRVRVRVRVRVRITLTLTLTLTLTAG